MFVLCALLAGSTAYSVPPEGSSENFQEWEKRKEARMKEVHRQLQLTPEQEKRLEEHRQVHREDSRKLHEEMRLKRDELRRELEKADFDAQKVKTVYADIKDIHNKIADHRLNGILEVRKVLSPEQFKKFQELMHEKHKMDGKGRRREGSKQ
jgi:Spy/CpxP family protein refolding chaperone